MSIAGKTLDMILLGSGWVNTVGEDVGISPITGTLDCIMMTSTSPSSGLRISTSSEGAHFPKLHGKKPVAVDPNSCVLFVAEDFNRDFVQFRKLTQSHAGYIVLIINHETDASRWEKMVQEPTRLFHLENPLNPHDVQEFVGGCVKKIHLYENLKAAEMVF